MFDRVAYKREWYIKNRERIRAKNNARYASDASFADDRRSRARRRYSQNSADIQKKVAAYAKSHPEKMRSWRSDWKRRHRDNDTFHRAARRAALRHAMPKWVDRDEIRKIYREARRLTIITGIPHHVDHIFPLVNERLCGLHVPWNLRAITAMENCIKHNKIPLESHGD